MKKFYENPTQVKYWDAENGKWYGGIAYHDEIICGCCGGIIEIEELLEENEDFDGSPIVEYCAWMSVSEEIMGSEDEDE